MKIVALFPAIVILAGVASCNRGDHFLKDKSYREKVEAQYEKQKQLAKNRWEQVFKIADQKMPLRENEALKFILTYSSLNDLADYDGDFFLRNIRASFAAKDTFSWGKTVPEELFRHFVLPVRVNNENLDTSRIVFFAELKDRIKKLPMREAILEVNHWCHEKVTYRGTDDRTSSPLATVRTAFGRCGEESTFTVAALRSVCIPARQCYTPRWAHSDDNHAWVEVWAGDKWHYIGACEPEPVLDAAWFTAPAKRAMLVNTNVFGDYEGPEDVLLKDERYTRINILSNYADTKRIYTLVRDSSGRPVDSAAVEFQLYNYAEFYPLLRTYSDARGICSFQTGYGDLIVWAFKNGRYAFRKISVKAIDTVVFELSMKPGREYAMQEDFVPPAEKPADKGIPDSLKEANTKRLGFEDQLRSAYEKTFIDSVKAYRLAATLKLNADTLWHFLRQSRGNYRTIIDFTGSVAGPAKSWLFPLLSVISVKDLGDISFDVLMDNVNNSVFPGTSGSNREIFSKYILNPRVDNEWLRPCKSFLQQKFNRGFKTKAATEPGMLAEWVKTNVLIDNKANYSRAPITPAGVYELKVSDPHSRDIFFVTVCRSLGIAARLEPGTRLPQYYLNNTWHDVLFDPKKPASGERVKLTLDPDPKNNCKPEYYTHFTLEKFDDGFFRSLDYETDPRLGSFPCELDLAPGYYLMVTGNRLKDGTVLANLSFFDLEQGKEVKQIISLRKEPAPSVLGRIDAKILYNAMPRLDRLSPGNLILAWMEPGKEPTKHFIADLKEKRKEFERKKCTLVFLFRNEKDKDDFISGPAREMPSAAVFMIQAENNFKMISTATGQALGSALPVVTLINAKGEILYLSQGYRIGIGDDLIRLLR
jgi:transglutaminase-like putative cysteine protease